VTTTVTATVTFAATTMTFVVTIVIVAAMTFAATTVAAATIATVTMAAATNNLGGVSRLEFGEEAFCVGSIQVRNLDESHSQTIPVITNFICTNTAGNVAIAIENSKLLAVTTYLARSKID
jgi:hypothetical protein